MVELKINIDSELLAFMCFGLVFWAVILLIVLLARYAGSKSGLPKFDNPPPPPKKNKTIEVTNCHECPFANDDNEFGKDICNLDDTIYKMNEDLPSNSVHENCPLKKQSVTVKLK